MIVSCLTGLSASLEARELRESLLLSLLELLEDILRIAPFPFFPVVGGGGWKVLTGLLLTAIEAGEVLAIGMALVDD